MVRPDMWRCRDFVGFGRGGRCGESCCENSSGCVVVVVREPVSDSVWDLEEVVEPLRGRGRRRPVWWFRVHRQKTRHDASHVRQVAVDLPQMVGPVDMDLEVLAHPGWV